MIRALAVSLALVAAAPAAADEPLAAGTFTTAFGDRVAADFGKFDVPERHEKPGASRITLPVVRFRTTAAQAGPPVVFLAGGPGASGLQGFRAGPFPAYMQLRAYADVITFDQRGTGAAEPSLVLPGRYDLPSDKALRDPAVAARFRQIAVDGAAEIRRRGIDLGAYNTAQSVQDIEALRRYLRAEKLVIWGHSYGSHLGLAYIKAHPDRVAGAVLSGVNDLGARWRLPSDSDAFLARVDAAAKADPRLARRMPSFLAATERVMRKLESEPQRITVDGKVSYLGREELQALIALQGGELGFVRALPLLMDQMDRGDFSRVAALMQQVRTQPLGTAMRHATHLASGVTPDRLTRIAAESPRSIAGDGINFPYNLADFREPWGTPDLGDEFRAATPSDVKVLFLNGQFDGRTSVREARETASRFRNGAFAEVDGTSHDIYGFSPAVGDAMIAFLRDGRRPPTHLPALPVEFRSPDEEAILRDLGGVFTSRGIEAALAKMEALARARSGPYFNVSTARQAGFVALETLKNREAAIRIFEMADRLYPGDFVIARQLGVLHKQAGHRDEARAYLEAARNINPLAPGIDAELATLGEIIK
jgi:pimeloyl-ACP methyl ester carboxylesterase